ncbi:hypothetical protein EC9_31480 [Rosistilla ulvae]|uniref:Uncharacterized protein n=1 Tax=Rosistilla ulvae TaxID=1930277 RepID=A0A517M248_9BACT|nr:hypothetical protein EC9_31480 [Rosistilla ulvae]
MYLIIVPGDGTAQSYSLFTFRQISRHALAACRFSHNELPCISRLGVSPGLVAAEPGLTPNRLIKPTSR